MITLWHFHKAQPDVEVSNCEIASRPAQTSHLPQPQCDNFSRHYYSLFNQIKSKEPPFLFHGYMTSDLICMLSKSREEMVLKIKDSFCLTLGSGWLPSANFILGAECGWYVMLWCNGTNLQFRFSARWLRSLKILNKTKENYHYPTPFIFANDIPVPNFTLKSNHLHYYSIWPNFLSKTL